ncbi:MAG TPA: efflux transporter outer membrane subunit [Methylocella sp.]|nr:efflux transporter outer membrane subunit [Methylocella sp.]
MRAIVLCAVGALALSACTVGPDFVPPPVVASDSFGPEPRNVRSRTTDAEPNPQWWRCFRDPELISLEERLAAQNLDLKTAAERVAQAGAARVIVASQGLPHVDVQSMNYYERISQYGTASLAVPSGEPLIFSFLQQGLSASWELDLFGKVRRAVEAQDATTLAAIENRRGVVLMALAELAQSYLSLRGTQTQLAIAERNLRVAEDDIRLVEGRFANGVATTLDLAQARSQRESIAETLPSLRAHEAQLINAVGLLLGLEPRALQADLQPPKQPPTTPRLVGVGLPATLLQRRPDVREAEARLHAALAEVGEAEAEFYPDVNLVGDFNVQSLTLKQLFRASSTQWTLGPTITIPIFEGGRLRGNLALTESRHREAAIDFQKTLLLAWQEVDDALTAYAQAQKRRAAAARAAAQDKIALGAARQRYQEGLVDFLNVNASLAQLLRSENDVVQSDVEVATDLVHLYRALGGGWEIAE